MGCATCLLQLSDKRLQPFVFKIALILNRQIDLPKVAKAVAELGRASVVQKKWQAEVRTKAEAAASQVEKIAKKGGLDADTVAEIRREILGVAG